jgi:hypothetical protein
MWGSNGKKPAAAHTACMFSLLGLHASLYRVGKHVSGGRSREGSLFAPWCYRMGPDINQCKSVSWKCRRPHRHNKQRTKVRLLGTTNGTGAAPRTASGPKHTILCSLERDWVCTFVVGIVVFMSWETQYRSHASVRGIRPRCLQRQHNTVKVAERCSFCHLDTNIALGSGAVLRYSALVAELSCDHSSHAAPPSVTRTGVPMWGSNRDIPAAVHIDTPPGLYVVSCVNAYLAGDSSGPRRSPASKRHDPRPTTFWYFIDCLSRLCKSML